MFQKASHLSSDSQTINPHTQKHFLQSTNHIQQPHNNQFFLKKLISSMKTKQIVHEFIYKMKRNVQTNRKIVQSQKQKYQKYLCRDQQSSIDIFIFEQNEEIRAIISFFTIIFSILLQFVSSFQCFFWDFREEYSGTVLVIFFKAAFLLFVWIKIILGFLIRKMTQKSSQYSANDYIKWYFTSTRFLYDFILSICAILLLALPKNQTVGLVSFFISLFVIFFIEEYLDIIELVLITNNRRRKYWELMKVVFSNIYFSHVIASFLFLASWINADQNWLTKYGISDSIWFQKYFYGYYWATTIIATVGFGDITPGNPQQALYIAFVILFGCLMLSFNISQIGSILSDLRTQKNQRKAKIATFKRMAKTTNIDRKLRSSIELYLLNSTDLQSQFEYYERKAVLESLPKQLRQEFQEQSVKAIFSKMFFFSLLQTDTKILISSEVNPTIISPGQYLTHKKYGLQRIQFIRKGKVGLAYKKKGSTINGIVMQTRDVHDQSCPPYLLNKFMLKRGMKINYDVIAQSYLMKFSIQTDKLLNCLRMSRHDYQFYCQLLDSASINLDESDSIPCIFCQHFHSIFRCAKLHYMPLRSIVFLKSQTSTIAQQNRNSNFVRCRIGLRKKKTYALWSKALSNFEYAFAINDMKHRNHNKSIAAEQIHVSSNKPQHQLQDNKHKINQISNWINVIFLNSALDQFEHGLVVDQLCNFQRYFPLHNPSTFSKASLNPRLKDALLRRFISNQ